MKKNYIRILSMLLVVLTLLSTFATTAFALSWDGSSTGGGGNTTSAGPNGYAIRTDGDNVIGYRFSIVDKSGSNKVSKVIDIFRNTTYGNYEYSNAYKFTTKYNKKQLINNQNSGYSTSKNSTNCYKEADCGFATSLPVASGMGTWQNNTTNLNKVLSLLGAGNLSGLKNGDKILVEPIYDLRLQSIYHAVTITETAIYGKHILGASSDGGSSGNSGSWGFISSYTNKYYPNQLYTPDGQGLWTGVSAASSRLTFYNMINQGYGVGIAYTETKSDFSPTLSVNCCEAWPGSKSTRNNNHYGISTGNSFSNWSYGHGYPYSGATVWYAVNFPAESENCYVKQSVWVVGGGSTSRNVYSNSNTWYDVSLSPTTIPNDKSYITVKARVDWINSSGTVLKYGTEKTFYIPVKPTVYRYQVSAVNYSGEIQAYNGSGGSSGKVYVGQKIYTKYKYTAKNTWTSYNNLYAAMHKWGGSDWVRVASSGTDLSVSQKALSSTISQDLTSTLGYIRVPDNSGSGSNVMKFKMTTQWYSDSANTGESTWLTLPIVKADVELSDMYLVDENGYIVDQNDLEVGQVVTVYHEYTNNTDTKIFVCGYNDDGSQISGVYAIPANGTITVAGAKYTVPNKRSFSIWGGVYLEGAGKGNTSWETNGTNNTCMLLCKSNHPVTITPIAPNSSYRAGTKVITSFYINNKSSDNYYTNSNLKVRFRVYNVAGTQKIYETTKAVVVPAKDKNLVYFAWDVPSTIAYSKVKIYADILDGGSYYNPVTNTRATMPYLYYTTPDTTYEDEAPSSFKTPTVPASTTAYTTWWEYSCSGKTFTKTYYGIGISKTTPKSAWVATGETATKSGSNWTMKSGYGVSIMDASCMTSVSGYSTPTYGTAYTVPQYANAKFPEYNYQYGTTTVITLKQKVADSYVNWVFPDIGDVENVHYTPVWYPDGDYTIAVIQADAWTPMGMLSCTDLISNIKISGNMYEDWHIGRQ